MCDHSQISTLFTLISLIPHLAVFRNFSIRQPSFTRPPLSCVLCNLSPLFLTLLHGTTQCVVPTSQDYCTHSFCAQDSDFTSRIAQSILQAHHLLCTPPSQASSSLLKPLNYLALEQPWLPCLQQLQSVSFQCSFPQPIPPTSKKVQSCPASQKNCALHNLNLKSHSLSP